MSNPLRVYCFESQN